MRPRSPNRDRRERRRRAKKSGVIQKGKRPRPSSGQYSSPAPCLECETSSEDSSAIFGPRKPLFARQRNSPGRVWRHEHPEREPEAPPSPDDAPSPTFTPLPPTYARSASPSRDPGINAAIAALLSKAPQRLPPLMPSPKGPAPRPWWAPTVPAAPASVTPPPPERREFYTEYGDPASTGERLTPDVAAQDPARGWPCYDVLYPNAPPATPSE